MDGVSSVASIIAIVQAAGMLIQVGKAFHDTFIGNESPLRVADSQARVASIEEFLFQIELFKAVKVTYPAASGPNLLDSSLNQCQDQIERLRKKLAKMGVPPNSSKFKKFVGAIKQRLNESEFAQIDAAITMLLQQLTLYISFSQLQLTLHGNDADHTRHGEILKKHGELELRFQQNSLQGLDQQTSMLELLGKLMDGQMALGDQISAFEQSHQILVGNFEKLSITPRLERTFSGTTAADEDSTVGDNDLVAPISPGLMKHPGYGFREDRLTDPTVAESVFNRVDEWLGPEGEKKPLLCILTTPDDDAVNDFCNRIVQEIAGSESKLLCYNGLPRAGPPPAPGWYTVTHAIWWLAGQLLIPVPHIDGHMPLQGYIPNVEAVCERLEKQGEKTVFVVLYLLTRSCPTDVDMRLYDLLISRLSQVSKTSKIRLLLFSDNPVDSALVSLPQDAICTYQRNQKDQVGFSEWEPKISNDEEQNEDDDDESL